MQHAPSRAERREERYSALIEKGHKSTMDNLYSAEVKRLRKYGYTVNIISAHPQIRDILICEVIFPQIETEN